MSGAADKPRVLLVDDDAQLGRLMQLVLQDDYRVSVATSLGQAQAMGRDWDVVVADVRLPNGDGRHLREHLDGVPFIVISGHPDEPGISLRKPFSMQELHAAVRTALTKGAA